MSKIILDLCGGSGAWSAPYKAAGYDVRLITLPEHDVRLYQPPANVHGVLAAPPCTVFASSGARWPRSDEDYRDGLSVVDACLRIAATCQPAWWAMENPIGRLVRWLGKPQMYFQPCDYGDPYTKRTALWGSFVEPEKRPVQPTQGSRMHLMSSRQRNRRAVTPPGFAQAFFEANP